MKKVRKIEGSTFCYFVVVSYATFTIKYKLLVALLFKIDMSQEEASRIFDVIDQDKKG